DVVAHATSVTGRAIDKTGRDALHRTYGTATSLRSLVRDEDVHDDVLVEHVRAKLGRLVSHPHAIRVAASNGTITLEGPILRREAGRLVRATRQISGVRDVIDELEIHQQAAHVPSLQGGDEAAGDRLDVFQPRWA